MNDTQVQLEKVPLQSNSMRDIQKEGLILNKTQDNKLFDTPVLFLIFNRPDLSEKVFGQIRKVRPRQLFIAADGPRKTHSEDEEKCATTRKVVMDMIDWDCEVKTLFREENLGCGLAVSQGITWFFGHVEMGIILEDDCYPDLSFFGFCEQLLKYYENDERIMMVSGTNLLPNWKTDESYFFSRIGTIWGWATWRRCWDLYDFEIKDLNKLIKNETIFNIPISENEIVQRIRNLKKIKAGELDTWDYQWTFTRLINYGLSIISSKNLVTNIGFNSSATHSNTKNSPFANLETQKQLLPLEIVSGICPNKNYDNIIANKIYPEPKQMTKIKKNITFIKRIISKKMILNKRSIKFNPKLHLGCGNRKIDGWINIDLANSDLNLDLSKGRLPFENESVEAVVSQHFFEHLSLDEELLPLLFEIFRVMKPNGEIWLSVPSIEKIAKGYLEDKGAKLLKGRMSRFPGYNLSGKPTSHIVNEIFCQNGEHKNLFDFELLNWTLIKGGFRNVVEVNENIFLNQFKDFPLRNDDDVSIYCKAIK